jgi:hypothetical protein
MTAAASENLVGTVRRVDVFASERSTPMARFLAAALHGAGPGSDRLHREIERINPSKNLYIGELITASARLYRGGLERNRYDSPVTWPPDDIEGFHESALNAAPTSRLHDLLSNCPGEIAEWLDSAGTVMTYLGVDFDQRRYKLYLFRDQPLALGRAAALESIAAALHSSAYIDCLELDMETAACTRSAYWKLGAVSLHDALDPAYRPHPEIENRILRLAGRTQVVSALEAIVAGQVRNEPIIKFRRPRGVWTAPDAGELAASTYAIECSLFEPDRRKYINDHTDQILTIAAAFSCRDDVARWLEQIRPFDCYLHYVGVGDAFVTFYYHCGTPSGKEVEGVARG